jgi:transposase
MTAFLAERDEKLAGAQPASEIESKYRESEARYREAEVQRQAALAQHEEAEAAYRAQIEDLKAEIEVLKQIIARRDKTLYGRRSERRKTLETASPSEPEGSSAAPAADEAPKPPKKKRKGHGPHQQPALPVDEITHTLADENRICDQCGGSLEAMGKAVVETELIGLRERIVVLERHLAQKYCCGQCRQKVVVADSQGDRLVPGGRYSLAFTCDVAYRKYCLHLPLERQAKDLARLGLEIETSTLCDQIDELATALLGTWQEICRRVQADPVLYADETPWAILSNGKTKNEKFWAWGAVGELYVAFYLLDSRSQESARIVLGNFRGTLMVDGLTSYPAAAKTEGQESLAFLVANCHAHCRRNFVDAKPHYPEEVEKALDWYTELYKIEDEAKQPGADRGALRDQRSRPILEALITWAKEQLQKPGILPRGALARAINYLINHEAGLRVFLDHPEVEIDNNTAERALRAVVLGRKNFLCCRSPRGAEATAILYTLVASAERCGVNPQAYLVAAAKHATLRAGATLMPDEFRQQLEAAHQELIAERQGAA